MSTYQNDYYERACGRGRMRVKRVCTFSWEEHCERRLAWLYGDVEARRRMSGQDQATEADLAAWSSLGTPERGLAA